MESWREELYHAHGMSIERPGHKYIKREWRNGRWVYYYELPGKGRQQSSLLTGVANFLGLNQKKRYYDARQEGIEESDIKNKTTENTRRNTQRIYGDLAASKFARDINAKSSKEAAERRDGTPKQQQEAVRKAREDARKAAKMDKIIDNVNKTEQEYRKTPAYAIETGRTIVEELLRALSKKKG